MWLYNGIEFTEDMIGDNVGFVYLITNTTNGKQYVGKKLFTKSKTYQKNKKKKRTRVSSDWIKYTGSNDTLNEDIKNGDVVKREILHLCKTKGWATYHETKEILVRDCLINDKYYNTWVSARIRRTHLK
jgi:hypothetical protein